MKFKLVLSLFFVLLFKFRMHKSADGFPPKATWEADQSHSNLSQQLFQDTDPPLTFQNNIPGTLRPPSANSKLHT